MFCTFFIIVTPVAKASRKERFPIFMFWMFHPDWNLRSKVKNIAIFEPLKFVFIFVEDDRLCLSCEINTNKWGPVNQIPELLAINLKCFEDYRKFFIDKIFMFHFLIVVFLLFLWYIFAENRLEDWQSRHRFGAGCSFCFVSDSPLFRVWKALLGLPWALFLSNNTMKLLQNSEQDWRCAEYHSMMVQNKYL